MPDDNFERLKRKYQPALDEALRLQVELLPARMQGDRLYVTGKAPTEAAKNKVWDAIKKIDSAYPDLMCDLDVAALADVQVHTVQAGDTLSKISLHYYGDAGQYMRIFDANRDQLDDPNGIKVGQRLLIPACS